MPSRYQVDSELGLDPEAVQVAELEVAAVDPAGKGTECDRSKHLIWTTHGLPMDQGPDPTHPPLRQYA